MLSRHRTRDKRSGKHRECHQRWACNKYLRYAVHLFSEHTITRCAWAEIYYKAHRTKDHSHASALRCLGQRWLKIIHKMWMDRTPYNAELHHLNGSRHAGLSIEPQEMAFWRLRSIVGVIPSAPSRRAAFLLNCFK